MAGSKPEELVARLYEEGMNDNEVKAQLIEFGLSSREIHALIKKAKEFLEKRSTVSQPVSEAEETAKPVKMIWEVSPAVEGPKIAWQPLSKAKAEEEKTAEGGAEAGTKREEKAQKEGAEKQKEGGGEQKKGRFSGLFGKKREKDAGVEKLKQSIVGTEPDEEEAPQSQPLQIPPTRPAQLEKQSQEIISEIFKKQGEAEPQEEERAREDEGRKKEQKEDKKESHKDLKEGDRQAKIKRLTLIKESIANAPPRPVPEIRQQSSLAGAITKAEKEPSRQTELSKGISYTDEEKMDQELVDRLTDGIESLEKDMKDIKQLMEILRELNIKLVELIENR